MPINVLVILQSLVCEMLMRNIYFFIYYIVLKHKFYISLLIEDVCRPESHFSIHSNQVYSLIYVTLHVGQCIEISQKKGVSNDKEILENEII